MTRVAAYLVEAYASRVSGCDVAAAAERASAAARGLGARHLCSIFVVDDELCFHLFEASSTDVVIETMRHARIDFQRTLEVELLSRPRRAGAETPRRSRGRSSRRPRA